jgi:Putative Actinobacterial Holin-X, holin superfamily III
MATSERPLTQERPGEPSPEQPLSELISRTTSDLSTLVREEIELAKIEIKDDLRHTAQAGGMFGAAGFAGYMAALLVSLAIVFALDLALPLWSACLIVGAIFAVVAYAMFRQGWTKMKEFTPGPEQTIETVKEDIEWVKARTK